MLAEERQTVGRRIPDTLQALIAARIDRLAAPAKRVLQRAAVIGRDLLGRRPRHALAGARRRRRRRSTTSCCATSSLREPRSSITWRARVSLQARPDPRGRLRGPVEVGPRRTTTPRFAGLAHGAGRRGAGRDPRLPPRPGARRCWPSSTARRRPSSRARRPRRSRRPASARSRGRRTAPARQLFLRAVELEPTLERRYLAARAAWRLTDMPAVAVEMDRVRADARRGGQPLDRGPRAHGAR